MTFDELLEGIAFSYLNPPKNSDGSMDADKNGHTRLTDLQKKYNLSSLKIQKLLVTAGVYQPVKKNSNYYAVKKRWEAGQSVEEIMQDLSLSKAAVNAFLPYERGGKNLDQLGMSITGDASRKRKQRRIDELKKENTRHLLAETMSDEALWNALQEYDQDIFKTEKGQRFRIKTSLDSDPVLTISKDNGSLIVITQQEVFDAYHKALEESAGGNLSLGDFEEYLRPLFVFFGIIHGDRRKTTTKRSLSGIGRCFCCGRSSDNLYVVSNFEDLLKLNTQFEQERKAEWSDTERNISEDAFFKDEQEYWTKRRQEQIAAARVSKAVEEFDQEGQRSLCKFCCQTIYDALEEGILPPASRKGGYEQRSDDELISYIHEECQPADCDYIQVFGQIYQAEDFDNHSIFLYSTMDKVGAMHSFALTVTHLPHAEGDLGLSFRATEVHKLTKAGKIAKDNTDTDYDISHFKRCLEGEDPNHKVLVGLAELMEKIKDTLRMHTLSESHNTLANSITIHGHHYGMGSIGTIIPTYVGQSYRYMSMKDRHRVGEEYGFLIDGKLFSGEELALMLSCYEGWQMKFYIDDPSSMPIRNDEALLQIRVSQKDLIDETIELINMFTVAGRFEREKDKDNFVKLFAKTIFEKFHLYHESRPRGYGKLVGMEIIKKLKLIEGTDQCQEMVRREIR